MTPAEFVDAKGGPAKIASDLAAVRSATSPEHGAGAIALWRHRNKIPRAAWPEILEAYDDVSMADLKAMEASSGSAPTQDLRQPQQGAA